MAITITDSPRSFTFLHQKLIYMASSTNVANTGFRYVVEVTVGGDTHTFTIPPNPSNRLVFDIRPVIEGYFESQTVFTSLSQENIHTLGLSDAFLHLYEDPASSSLVRQIDVVVKEGWIIAGVFTPTAVGQATDSCIVLNSKFENYGSAVSSLFGGKSIGYKPTIDMNSTKIMKDWPSDLNNRWTLTTTYSFSPGQAPRFPITAADAGVISFIADDGTYFAAGNPVAKVRITIYESNGTPNTADYNITTAPGRICHFGVYPYNLDNTGYVGFLAPSSFPNYRAYTIELLDAGNVRLDDPITFYPTENYDYDNSVECRTESRVVRAGWRNSSGGWSYFNFIFQNITSYGIDRKMAHQILGDYAGTSFTYYPSDRGMTNYHNRVEMYLTATSDHLSSTEFKYVGNMFRSNDVQLIFPTDDSVSSIPVILEDSNYEEQRESATQLKRLTVKFKLARQLW